MPLDPSPKIGFDSGGVYKDVTELLGLPTGGASSAETTVTISSASATASIDTGNYRFASVQMTAGYSGMSSLTPQCSNDNAAFFSAIGANPANTSSGISTNMGTGAAVFLIPLPYRYLRFQPAGTYVSGTCTLKITLYSDPQFLPSIGANVNLAAVGGSIAPAISTSTMTLGTSTGNSFQVRVTNTTTVAATTLLAAVSGQMPYLTDLNWTYVGTGNPILTLQAAANALIPMDIIMEPNKSDSYSLRHPHKFMSTTNNILQYVVTGTFTGTWYFTARGYYTTS